MSYYYSDRRAIPLVADETLLAVRPATARGERLLATQISDFVPDAEGVKRVGFVPRYNFHILRVDSKRGETRPQCAIRVRRSIARINTNADFRWATPVHRIGSATGRPVFLSNQIVVKFQRGMSRAQIDAINRQFGARIVASLPYAENGFLLQVSPRTKGSAVLDVANAYVEFGYAMFSHPNLIYRREWKARPSRRPRSVGYAGADGSGGWSARIARVPEAWTLTRGSADIRIGILDDGIDIDHQEFAGKLHAAYDFLDELADGRPRRDTDNHGTACAGVAAAAGIRFSGVAPGCQLVVARAPDDLGVAEEAQMFYWAAAQGADVISCSWGGPDNEGEFPLADNVREAIHYCVSQGRQGRGTAVFFAGGNGGESVMSDGYARNPDVIAVAASTSSDQRAWYSDYGAAIWISAPSSGDTNIGEHAIQTTDRTGAAGYNEGRAALGDPTGDYTNDFGGTSAAAPFAAGVAALVLSANPTLTAQELREVLRDSAVKIDPAGGGYQANGHSPFYGYGRLDALAAVQAAQARGGAPSTHVAGTPQLQAPVEWDRGAAAPTIQVDLAPNAFYAVEVATDPALFEPEGEVNWTPDNFFATWMAPQLAQAASYTLDADAWDRLRRADRVYFRLWTSSLADTWQDMASIPPADQVAQAPSTKLLGAVLLDVTLPAMQGPTSWSRQGAAPSFTIDTAGRPYFAVEVTTRAELFDYAAHGADRDNSTFFASWEDGALETGSTYILPQPVWETLRAADALYYRVWVFESADAWSNGVASVSGAAIGSAPLTWITDDAVAPPADLPRISTVAAWRRDGPPPQFLVEVAEGRFYAVELATRGELFDVDAHGDQRTVANFYASWTATSLESAPVFTPPESAWQALHKEDVLYFRVWSSSVADAWTDIDVSTPDQQYDEAPSLLLLDDDAEAHIARQAKSLHAAMERMPDATVLAEASHMVVERYPGAADISDPTQPLVLRYVLPDGADGLGLALDVVAAFGMRLSVALGEDRITLAIESTWRVWAEPDSPVPTWEFAREAARRLGQPDGDAKEKSVSTNQAQGRGAGTRLRRDRPRRGKAGRWGVGTGPSEFSAPLTHGGPSAAWRRKQ